MKFSKPVLSYLFLQIGLWLSVTAQIPLNLEAEEAVLSGTANVVSCSRASGGEMVRGIHQGPSNRLKFQQIQVDSAGLYFFTISYIYTQAINFNYEINGGATKTKQIEASGSWCFEGGSVRSFIFLDSLQAGMNEILFFNAPILDKLNIRSDTSARSPATFFVSSLHGNDDHDGLSPNSPFESITKVNSLDLVPGDSLLFSRGESFSGRLEIHDESGTETQAIYIGAYGNGRKPILDGHGFLSAFHIKNSEHLVVENLELKNDGGLNQPGESSKLRYGLFLENTFSDGTIFQGYEFRNLIFKNIYPTEQISDDDQTGIHAYGFNTSGSWGDLVNPTRFANVLIRGCYFTRTGRHALRLLATQDAIIEHNIFEHVGGAGMVLGANCSDVLVQRNLTNYTGSSIDPRMAGRGSGLWVFKTRNVIAQFNQFKHARGIKDSFGMHIDIGNRNVVYQYNYSEDNEGGFAEILGDNRQVGYRYNISLGDGWRTKGPQVGRIFWIGGWSGNPNNPIGSDSVFIYNNSLFVRDSIAPSIWIEAVTRNSRIYNNIIHVSQNFGQVFIKNSTVFNDFNYNMWYGNVPTLDGDHEFYQGAQALFDDPAYLDAEPMGSEGFVLQKSSPAIGTGKLLYSGGVPDLYSFYDYHGGRDYFGNPVSNNQAPNIGAYNGSGDVASSLEDFGSTISLYPNPVRQGDSFKVELPDVFLGKELKMEILDIRGKVLISNTGPGKKELLFFSQDLREGAYYFRLEMGERLIIHPFIVH